jgi:DNA polymerase III subunit alpha, Gram-positive type
MRMSKISDKFSLFALDTETTGLDPTKHDIIEISIYRLNDDEQRTWFMKPSNYDAIEPDALRVNGAKLEDLKHQTKEGREKYRDPAIVLPEIEGWLLEDMTSPEDKILVGQNIGFDCDFIQALWAKNNASETFPFGTRPRLLDTMQIELLLDLARGERSEYYNLGSLVEKHGVKRERAHKASNDTRMTKNVFLSQLDIVKKAFDENIIRRK